MPDSTSVNNDSGSHKFLAARAKRTNRESTLRILFWGTCCDFSTLVLTKLLENLRHVDPSEQPLFKLCAVMVPAKLTTSSAPPVRRLGDQIGGTEFMLFDTNTAPDLVQLAQVNRIPTYEIGSLSDPKLADYTQSVAVDVVCVAC